MWPLAAAVAAHSCSRPEGSRVHLCVCGLGCTARDGPQPLLCLDGGGFQKLTGATPCGRLPQLAYRASCVGVSGGLHVYLLVGVCSLFMPVHKLHTSCIMRVCAHGD